MVNYIITVIAIFFKIKNIKKKTVRTLSQNKTE